MGGGGGGDWMTTFMTEQAGIGGKGATAGRLLGFRITPEYYGFGSEIYSLFPRCIAWV